MDYMMYNRMRVDTFLAVASVKTKNKKYFQKTEEEKQQLCDDLIKIAEQEEMLPDQLDE